jgi:hypothetical protein
MPVGLAHGICTVILIFPDDFLLKYKTKPYKPFGDKSAFQLFMFPWKELKI